MSPHCSHDLDHAQIAAVSIALVEQFGPVALGVARTQAAVSADGVSACWDAIARHIASSDTLPV